ncbi:MAG TPA: hypothetical protein VE093_09885 [Polyangiaceae bacterium]|nr:hypothetical protein [Polyangiaceae bacterium]
MKRAAILELRLKHTFYLDGRCPDFTIEPSAETTRLLQRHRCLLRSTPDGVRVITPLDGSQPALPLPDGAALHFYLRLENSDFALFTDLTGINLTGTPKPLFTNAGLGSAGALALVPSEDDRRPGVFADIEIHLSGLGPEPGAFYVEFKAKKARWAYYCVTDLVLNEGGLRILDEAPAGTTDKLLFSPENRTRLDEQPDPSDPVAEELARLYQGMRRVRMISDQAVDCRETPRKHLELWHGLERLASSLQNPSVRRVSRISALPQEDVLVHVIKYRTDPFYNP